MEKNKTKMFTSIDENIFERTATDETINQIIEFINKNFNLNDNSLSQLENCRKLSGYLIKNNITLGDIESDKLLDESKELMTMLDILSKSKTISEAYNCQNLITLLENYSQKTNSQLEDDFENIFFRKKDDKDLDLFKLYLTEIGQYKLLTREEEKELAIKSRNGDTQARNKLVEHNLRLVIPIAKRFVTPEMSLQDLVLAGNEGVMIAAKRFDPNLGYKFSTYATWWIRQSIQRGIIECGRAIKIPSHIYEYVVRFKKEIAVYYSENGEYPSNEYLAERFNMSLEKVNNIRQTMEPIISLSTPIGSEEKDTTLGDMIEDENNPFDESIDLMDAETLIFELLDSPKITEKEKEVIKLRYGFYGEIKTLEEIGKMYNLTRERIRQIEARALRKLLFASKSYKFKAYSRSLSR